MNTERYRRVARLTSLSRQKILCQNGSMFCVCFVLVAVCMFAAERGLRGGHGRPEKMGGDNLASLGRAISPSSPNTRVVSERKRNVRSDGEGAARRSA